MARDKYAPPTGFKIDAAEQAAPADLPTPPKGFTIDVPEVRADAPMADQVMPDAPDRLTVDVVGGTYPEIKFPAGTNPEHATARVRELFAQGKDPAEIRAFITQHGGSFVDPQQADELFQNYETDAGTNQDPRWKQAFAAQPDYTPFKVSVAPEQVSTGEAAATGLRQVGTMGWGDELTAFARSKIGLSPDGQGPAALYSPGMSQEQIYNEAARLERGHADDAWNQHPLAYMAGGAVGMAPTAVLAPGSTVPRLMASGAVLGGISGAGNATEGNRLSGGAQGAAIGAVAAPVLAKLAGAVQTVGGNAVRRIIGGQRNNLNSGLDALARAAPQEADAMATRAATMRAGNVEPTLNDVVDESGRGVISSAALKMTPGRQAVNDYAEGVRQDMQGRVIGQARRVIDASPTTARRLAADVDAERADLAGPEFDAIRSRSVPVTPEIATVLRTPEGQRTLNAATQLMTPEERGPILAMLKAVKSGNMGGGWPAEIQATIDKLPAGLSPAARQSAIAQITRGVEPVPPPDMTVDIADKFSRILLKRAQANNPGLARVAGDMGVQIRDAARSAVPEYGQALDNFAARARVGDAAAGRGRFEDTHFTNTPADTFSDNVAAAQARPPAVANGETLPSEADAIRLRARDTVADQAGKGPSEAVGIARRIANGHDQALRSQALLGNEGANNLRTGMSAEVARLRNANAIDPMYGSKTARAQSDQEGTDELINLGANALSGGKWHVVREAARWLKGNGISGVDAERLSRDAVNPARTEAAIEYLVQKGLDRARARSLVNSIGLHLGVRGAGAVVDAQR